jgi:hypothetical protein
MVAVDERQRTKMDRMWYLKMWSTGEGGEGLATDEHRSPQI